MNETSISISDTETWEKNKRFTVSKGPYSPVLLACHLGKETIRTL